MSSGATSGALPGASTYTVGPYAQDAWPNLPSRRKYFITITSVAFFAGVGFGVGYAVRYSRRMRLEELRAAADAAVQNQQRVTLRSSVPHAVQASLDQSTLGVASSKGPLALFREMNKAAFKRIRSRSPPVDLNSEHREHPHPPRLHQPRNLESLHSSDSDLGAAPPSILMRSTVMSGVDGQTAPKLESGKGSEVEEVPLGQTPAVLGAKALAVATLIVGVTAVVSVEVVYRLLGVKNTDELIDRLSTIIPPSEQSVKAFEPVGRVARRSLGGTFGKHQVLANEIYDDQHDNVTEPLNDLDDTLQQLDDAVERGDTQTWFQILSKRLNAERRFDVEERRRRIAAIDEQLAK